ncbi:MAG TPA: hypothetical protein EYQ50_24675, partial [Verrucomicrobiales bacterium]|nr:hypothetical protein [Verrucomicrobiales bacterium]
MDVHELPHTINLILVGLEAEDRDRIIKLVPDSWVVKTSETMPQAHSLNEAARVFLYGEGFLPDRHLLSDNAQLNGLCAVALSDHRILEDSHESMHAKQGEGFRSNAFNWKSLKRSLCEILENHRLRLQCSLLEEQLFQSRKLESLGVMAAGLAHDFNNMLAGILANVDLAKDYVESESTLEEFMLGIEKSSLRAADLTRQILLYSGKVRMDSGRTDLYRLIRLSEPLIRSAI